MFGAVRTARAKNAAATETASAGGRSSRACRKYMLFWRFSVWFWRCPRVMAAGMGAEGEGSGGGDGGGGSGGGAVSDPQLPPTSSAADINAWLAEGHYKSWACESAEHEAVSPSPHGFNRICSNDVLSGHAGTGEYPVGSAAVKELWDAMGGEVIGYATYRHTKAGTTGDTWFWFEVVPLDHPAPHDEDGVVAFGPGDSRCRGLRDHRRRRRKACCRA